MPKPIGILGGTFDPIHLGHLHLASSILSSLDFQAIHLVPCHIPVHRSPPIASAKDRLEMVKLAVADDKGLLADDIEIKRQGPSYMIDTLKSLKTQFAKTPLTLILSNDAFRHFLTWKDWQDFLTIGHIVVANRPNYHFEDNPNLMAFVNKHLTESYQALHSRLSGAIMLTQIDPSPLSATDIREQLATTAQPDQFVKPAVWHYIQKHNLYGV